MFTNLSKSSSQVSKLDATGMSNEQILERKRFAARYKVYFLSIMLRFTDSDCKTFSREEKNKKTLNLQKIQIKAEESTNLRSFTAQERR